ncbi:T9SS type A sorting domain-containing protein [Niastella caeni]|nr:T9SS type A sorting domain-containing protein [Niastella caeni]
MKLLCNILLYACVAFLNYNAKGQVAIYTGGSGDGFASAVERSVITGGAGDGYATAQITVPLPVHLLFFKASRTEDRSVQIIWSAETDALHDRFELERSYNAFNFTVIDVKKNANPGALAKVSCSVTDESAVAAAPAMPGKINVYYRLRSVDKDGSFSYSPVQRIAFDPTGVALINKVYPNPGNGIVYVETVTSALITYRLYDAQGRTVAAGNFSGNTTLPFSNMAAGSYWLHAESNGRKETFRIDIVR